MRGNYVLLARAWDELSTADVLVVTHPGVRNHLVVVVTTVFARPQLLLSNVGAVARCEESIYTELLAIALTNWS